MLRDDLATVRAIFARKRRVKACLQETAARCRPGFWYLEGPYARHQDATLPDGLRDAIRGIRRRRVVRELVERLTPPWHAVVAGERQHARNACSIAYLSNGGNWKLFDLENRTIWTRSLFVGKITREAENLTRFGPFFNIPSWRTIEERDTLWRFEQFIAGPSLASCAPAERSRVLHELFGHYEACAAAAAVAPDPQLTRDAIATMREVAPLSLPAKVIDRFASEFDALGTSLKLMPAHGDLSGVNVFLSDGKAWIIDWENAGRLQPVVYDMLYVMFREAALGRPDLLEALLRGSYDSGLRRIMAACGMTVPPCDNFVLLMHTYVVHFHAMRTAGKSDAEAAHVNDLWNGLLTYCRAYV